MRSYLLALIVLLLIHSKAIAQYGCTDPQATNYDPSAVFNDGTCSYPSTSLPAPIVTALQTPALDENSGLLYTNASVWTHVDDTYEELYQIDTLSGAINQITTIPFSTNTDWEDIDKDSLYVYIGDIGNNYGNRTDLKFYRISRTALDSSIASTSVIDTISFSYPDQFDFTAALNNTRFDAEAFIVFNDTIHLFSKDWVFRRARHYVIPAIPGNHVAQLRDSIDANGLITGATLAHNGVIALLGYDKTFPAPCFVWMLSDYNGSNVFSGNKRYFSLGSAITFGQSEGITFTNGYTGYISNERFQQSIINVPPSLRRFDLSPYIQSTSTGIDSRDWKSVSINPQPASDHFQVSFAGPVDGSWRLLTISGEVVSYGAFKEASTSISCNGLTTAIYLLEVIGKNGKVYRTKVMVH